MLRLAFKFSAAVKGSQRMLFDEVCRIDSAGKDWEIAARRIGTGEQAVTVGRTSQSWPGIAFNLSTADISGPTDWIISEVRHTVIVHLGGRMDVLETELDGHGGSSGPANPGEIWTVPAGKKIRKLRKRVSHFIRVI